MESERGVGELALGASGLWTPDGDTHCPALVGIDLNVSARCTMSQIVGGGLWLVRTAWSAPRHRAVLSPTLKATRAVTLGVMLPKPMVAPAFSTTSLAGASGLAPPLDRFLG